MIKEVDGKLYLWTFGLVGWITAEYEEGESRIVTDVRNTIEKQGAKSFNDLCTTPDVRTGH